jgi:FMN-dependent oxidoreductase (nitrilotriacetate monooxygenase family)
LKKTIRLNAFSMNCVGHLSAGLWRVPGDQSHRYTDLDYWIDLARLLEKGRFDALFIADVLGVYDVYRSSAGPAFRSGAQVPVNDPLQLVPAMAAATRHLGFGVTASVAFEHPYPFARRMSTLDHLTKGRAGWNIVTSYLDSGARNLGMERQLNHDNRYDVAEEYLEVCYKLWETSWEDGAVRLDHTGIYADPSKIHEIRHSGQYFNVPGYHLSEPSPQRTPVLYQAGASSRGRDFAARHSECAFVAAPSKKLLSGYVKDLRRRVVLAGRDAQDVKIFPQLTVIVAATDAAAQAKLDSYRPYIDTEAALVLMSGWTGVDLSQFDPDVPLQHLNSNAIQFTAAAFSSADPTRTWTVRQIAEYCGIGGDGPVLVGSAATVADALEGWVEDTDVDGFNLAAAVNPDTFRDVVEYLVPELQRRGIYKTDYSTGTLREKLFGRGPRLHSSHAGAGQRDRAVAPARGAA